MDNHSPNSLTEVDADYVEEESEEVATASLFEVMTSRNRFLREKELWAVCRECCLTLEYVHDCHDLFQSLCLSPFTVAFDPEGNLCFLDLDAEPESIYLPPEHTPGQNTYKTHLYSLGMTLLFATEYNSSSEDPEAVLGDTFTNLLAAITQEDSERRPGLHTVLGACDTALAGESSQDICVKIVGYHSSESPEPQETESGSSLQETADELCTYLETQTDLIQSSISDNIHADNEGNIQTGKHDKRKSAPPDTLNNANKNTNGNHFYKITSSDIAETNIDPKQQELLISLTSPNTACDDDETMSDGTDDTVIEQLEKHKCTLLTDLLTLLNRPLDESELWSICRECVLSLQRKRKNTAAYISLETLIIKDTGSLSIKVEPKDKQLDHTYIAPELQQSGMRNEKACVYALGISLQKAASFRNTSNSFSNNEALEILISSFINVNPDMRPDLDTAFEMCEEYEKVSATSSQQVCLQLFEEAMKTTGSFCDTGWEQMKQASDETTEHLVGKGSTKPENNVAEEPHNVEQSSAQTLSPRSQSAFKTTGAPLAAVTSTQSLSAFRHVIAESKPHHANSRIPSAYTSLATHFKPIVIHPATSRAGVSDQPNTEVQTANNYHVVDRTIKQDHQEHSISESSSKVLKEFGRTTDRHSVSNKQTSQMNILPGLNNSGQTLNQFQSQYLAMDSSATQDHAITKQMNCNANTDRDSSVTNRCIQMPATAPQFSTKSQQPSQANHFSQQNTPHSFQNNHPINQTATFTAVSNSAYVQQPPQKLSQNISTLEDANVRTDNSSGITHNSIPNNVMGAPLVQGSDAYTFPLPAPGAKTNNGHYFVPFSGYPHTNWPLQYTLVPDPTTGFMQMLPVQYVPFSQMQTYQDIPLVHSHRSDLNANSLPIPRNETYNAGQTDSSSSLRFSQGSNLFRLSPDKLLPSYNIQPYSDRSRMTERLHSSVKHSASLKPAVKASVDYNQRYEEDSMQSTSTSPSKDSGISLNQQSEHLTHSTDKPANADRILSKVIHILQYTFEGDLSVDLATEDVSMGKYVMSLSCLTWDTFCHAMMEKYAHLKWSYEVLSKLYEAVGGYTSSELQYYNQSPPTKYDKPKHRQKTEYQQSELNDTQSDRLGNHHVEHKQLQDRQGKHKITFQEQQQHKFTRQQLCSYSQHENKHLFSQHQQERYQRSHNMQPIFNQPTAGSPEQLLFNHNFSAISAIPNHSRHSVRSPTNHRPASELKKPKYVWSETAGSRDSEMMPNKQPFQRACELDKTKRSLSLHNINFTSLSAPVYENVGTENIQKQRLKSNTRVNQNQSELINDYSKVKQSYNNKRHVPSHTCEDNPTFNKRIPANSHGNKTNRSINDAEKIYVIRPDSAYDAVKFTQACDGYNSPSSLVSCSSSSKPYGSQEHKQVYTSPNSSSKSKVQGLQDTHSLCGVAVNASPFQPSHVHSDAAAVVQINRNNTDSRHFRPQMSKYNTANNSQEPWSDIEHQSKAHVTYLSHDKLRQVEDIENQTSTISRPLCETVLDHCQSDGQNQHNPSTSNTHNGVSCQDVNQYSHFNNNPSSEVRKLAAKKPELYNNRCSMESSMYQDSNKKMRADRFADSNLSHHTSQSESSVSDNEHQNNKNHGASGNSHFSHNFDSKFSDSSHTLVASGDSLASSGAQDINIDDNNRKQPTYSRSLSATFVRQSNQQPKGVTVFATETEWGAETRQRRGLDERIQLSEANNKLLPYDKKITVVFHSAMVQLNLTPEVNAFIHSIDEENRPAIEKSLTSIKQEIAVYRRQKLKTQKLFRKLNDQNIAGKKGDQNVIEQMLRDITEMTRKLSFLYLCQTHYQMLLAELHGLDASLLYSLAVSEGGSNLSLQPVTRNPQLQFRSITASDGEQMTVLQAGTPRGLMSYLYTTSALSIGYIHQFLLCFRYIVTAEYLLSFIIEKYNSARRSNQKDGNIICIQCRSTDLLHFWIEGFFSIDFAPNKGLLKKFADFLAEQTKTNANVENIDSLFSLYAACRMGENAELINMTEMNQNDTEEGAYFFSMGISRRWDSFRSLLKRSSSDKSNQSSGGSFGKGRSNMKALSPEHGKPPPPSLEDCPAQELAEQLTLIEQELFKRCHPVHFLNSQFQGVGVALSMPGLRTPSMARKSEAIQGPKKGLFVGEPPVDSYVVRMINHSQELAHWVSAEILGSGSSKAQVGLITKFLTAARLCQEIRNYATALSILDGLENLVIRQLPAWKHVPAKSLTYMDELTNIKMKLKSEALWLMKDKDWYTYPTIPCALFFALHMQQVEIGSFTLANGMYKLDKMRSITDIVDQLRIFRDHSYGFQPDFEIQRFIHRCLAQYSEQDLHMIASAHESNFRKHPSSTSLSGTLKMVKGMFKKKS
ncbi:hypothetical protein BsWGS_04643 [Bradybaena similaris]